MSLTSVWFIPFIAITWILYFVMPKRWQWCVILLANIVFVVQGGGVKSLAFMAFTAVTVYGYALVLEKRNNALSVRVKACSDRSEKKKLKQQEVRLQNIGMWIVLGANFGVWYAFKLADRFWNAAQQGHGFWMPLAMSFYTFIAVGYLIDVYRKKIPAEKNLLHFFTFMTYFPQMTEGPFSRYEDISEALFGGHSFSWERLEEGCFRIIWGFCKKLLVADVLWNSLQMVLNNGSNINAKSVLVTIFLLPLQQYMDFSGCMDIVMGISHVCGIDMKENFKQPEFSKSIAEVWRRWHITLCLWFKDYVFYPVATNKLVGKLEKAVKKHNKQVAKYISPVIAMFFVWTITGLWHGATLNNLAWGWMNFIILSFSFVMEAQYKKWHEKTHIRVDSTGWKTFSIVRTIFLFGIMEIMADVTSASQALQMYLSLFRPAAWQIEEKIIPDMEAKQLIVILIFSVMVIALDIAREFGKIDAERLMRIAKPVKVAAFVSLFYCLVYLTVAGLDSAGFAYARF